MNAITQHIDQFSGRNQKWLDSLTQPLLSHFGIHYFCYQKVDTHGRWEIIANQSAWLHHSADQQFYRYDPSLIDPRQYQSGIILPATHAHQEFQDTLGKDAIEKFDINHPLAIVRREKDYCEYFFFAAPSENINVYNIYLNKLNHLRKFIEYFKNETKQLRNEMAHNPIDILSVKGETFTTTDNKLLLESDLLENDAFLNSINKVRSLATLSKRELQCLHYYRNGYTAKETAKALSISYRTVEEHIENLKRKCNCRYKRQLLLI